MTSFKQQLARWSQGLLRGCIQGGAIAAKAIVGTAALGAMGVPNVTLSFKQSLAVFASGALYHLWDYLATTPLPDLPAPESAIGDRPSAITPIPPIPPISPPAP